MALEYVKFKEGSREPGRWRDTDTNWFVNKKTVADHLGIPLNFIEFFKVNMETFSVYRKQIARLYYSKREATITPKPFAEYRVYVYLFNPKDVTFTELRSVLNDLEKVLSALANRSNVNWRRAVYYEEQLEEEEIDYDEVNKPIGEINRYAAFYGTNLNLKGEYNERDISHLESETLRYYQQEVR